VRVVLDVYVVAFRRVWIAAACFVAVAAVGKSGHLHHSCGNDAGLTVGC
jgi:hypothetical protein